MMRSLYSGVAGLRTHQTKMDVLGNNIANVNTTSFKSQSITFSDLMYQTTQAASGATETKGGVNARQIGLGAKSGAIGTAIESQGATQTTNNPFDIMITGKAFFVVNNGKENLYTRDGSFYVDGAGNLAMQSNGYFVMGWNAIEDPDTGEITVNKNGELSNLQIMSAENSTYSPASTTSALVSGNIDDKDPNVVSDDGKTITLEFYDNKGYLYTGKFNIKDTGEDHLFSCELTEIIDSKGNKLTAAQMEGVSFGNIQDSEGYKEIQGGYYIAADATDKTVATIYQQSGQTVFENVPATGDSITTLSNIEGFLSKMYPTASTKRYANIKNFEINQDTLDVTFDFSDFSSSITNTTYKSFVKDNTDYYYSRQSDNFGYLAPSQEGGKLNSLNTEMLDNVFDLNSTTASTILADISNYRYTFEDDKLTVTASKVPEDTEEAEKATKLKSTYNNYFKNKDSSGKTISDIIAEIAADDTNYPYGAYYEYSDSDGILNIYGGKSKTENKNNDASITPSATPKLFDLLSDKITSDQSMTIPASTSTEFAQLKALVDAEAGADVVDLTSANVTAKSKYDALTADFTITITDNDASPATTYEITVADDDAASLDLYNSLMDTNITLNYTDLTNATLRSEFKSLVTESDIDNVDWDSAEFTPTLRDITGTTGFTTKVYYDVKSLDLESTPYATFNRNTQPFNADTTVYDYDVPTIVFRDSATKKTGYVLSDGGDGFTMDEVAPILQKIYGVTADEVKVFNKGKTTGFTDDFSSLQNEEFNVSFINGGKITITHEWTDNVELNPDYLCEVTDGVAKYTTANDVIAYPLDTTDGKTFALEGNISDILTTANTQTKGLLQNVYGITDADARAYGSEGYYTIDEDLGIKLYTSKADMSRANKTIQLVFDAATGNIKSANENETTKKVDLVFDQSVPGLEAFGFQETPGSERTVGSIEIDFSTVTNYNTNGSSTIKVVKGDKSSLNTGRAVGEMNGVTISTDGTIYATYSNGQTKLLGQIASAEFANASGLAKEGDNLYASTLNSGEATIQDITTDGGYMNTGVLEMSNVDLSKEFTEMITTQRGFQANSRIITVSDTLLEELTNLKR